MIEPDPEFKEFRTLELFPKLRGQYCADVKHMTLTWGQYYSAGHVQETYDGFMFYENEKKEDQKFILWQVR